MTTTQFLNFEKKMKFDAPATVGALKTGLSTVYAYRTGERNVPPYVAELIRYILKFGILPR